MAKPRVLVSSTCADLYIIREQLGALIERFGYDPVLSEDGDIYYSPDLHVHLSCIREVHNCDMVVLLVGNKFGSEFTEDRTRSITQAEHDQAFLSRLPIFAFIQERVLHDHTIYKRICDEHRDDKEKIETLLSEIPFGAQTDLKVFPFIDDISKKVANNAYFPFKDFSDIENVLKKQWAGMLFDFLRERRDAKANQSIVHLLTQIEIASTKVEGVVDLLAANAVPTASQADLKQIEYTANEKRLHLVLSQIWQSFSLSGDTKAQLESIETVEWTKIYEMLMESPIDIELCILLTGALQDSGIINPNSHYVHYLIDIRLSELREICKRYEIDRGETLQAIKDTLVVAIQKAQEESED